MFLSQRSPLSFIAKPFFPETTLLVHGLFLAIGEDVDGGRYNKLGSLEDFPENEHKEEPGEAKVTCDEALQGPGLKDVESNKDGC